MADHVWTLEQFAHYQATGQEPLEPAPEMLERQFMYRVKALAIKNGYLVFHTYDSRRSDVGFPDLVLVNHSGVIWAELKTNTGKLTSEQAVWLDMLRHAGQEAYCWRPSDWPALEARLTRGTP